MAGGRELERGVGVCKGVDERFAKAGESEEKAAVVFFKDNVGIGQVPVEDNEEGGAEEGKEVALVVGRRAHGQEGSQTGEEQEQGG